MLVDSHAHLDFVDDLPDALQRAQSEGVGKIVTIGTSIESSKKAIEIADPPSRKVFNPEVLDSEARARRAQTRGASEGQENIPEIYATCGIHPQDGRDEVEKLGLDYIDILKSVINSSDKVVAIGECGLDYYLPGEKRIPTVDKDKKFQRELFKTQINLAAELNLPLVVHCRSGWDEIFDLLSSVNREQRTIHGVFHSWTGDWQAAKKAIDLDFYISFSGIVTYKNALDVQTVARKAPLERILVETDSPFLSPRPPSASAEGAAGRAEPLRGKPNEPKNVRIVAQFLTHLRNQPIDQIIEVTAENAQKLFGI